MRKNDMITGLIKNSDFVRAELLRRVYGRNDETLLVGSYIVDFDFKSGTVTLMDKGHGGEMIETGMEDFAYSIKQ